MSEANPLLHDSNEQSSVSQETQDERKEDEPSPSQPQPNSNADHTSSFECNICFEAASDPVISLCGHLFCWPCIFRWLEEAGQTTCPVCKAGVTKQNVIPLYGRGKSSEDPRNKPQDIPRRPAGQRPEPQQPRRTFSNMFENTGFSFSGGFGLGVFPPLFGTAGGGYGAWEQEDAQPNQPEQAEPVDPLVRQQQLLLSRALVSVGFVIILGLIFIP